MPLLWLTTELSSPCFCNAPGMQEYEALQSKPVAQLTNQDRQRLDNLQEQLQSAQQQLQAAQQQAQQLQLEAAAAQRRAELVATANVSTRHPSVTVHVTLSALQLVRLALLLVHSLLCFDNNTVEPSLLPTSGHVSISAVQRLPANLLPLSLASTNVPNVTGYICRGSTPHTSLYVGGEVHLAMLLCPAPVHPCGTSRTYPSAWYRPLFMPTLHLADPL